MSARAAKRNPGVRTAGGRNEQTRGRWAKYRGWIAGGVIAGLVLTVAVASNGFDAREVLRKEPSVWVARDAGQYARVNTETGEIDTVRKVAEPSGVLQLGPDSVVLASGNGKAWPVNPALPTDFVDSGQGAAGQGAAGQDGANGAAPGAASEGGTTALKLPDGTREIIAAGRYALLRTESGAVYVGRVGAAQGESTSPEQFAARLQSLRQIDPLAKEAAEAAARAGSGSDARGEGGEVLGLRVDAIALDESGLVALYSAADGTVWRYDARRGAFLGRGAKLPDAAKDLGSAQLALVGGEWALLDSEGGALWREGGAEAQLELSGTPKLQASGPADGQGSGALIADVSGLWRVTKQGEATRIVSADGTPAQPRAVEGTRFAAWIGQNGGTLWSSAAPGDGTTALAFDDSASDLGEVAPTFYTNGERAVLGEARTGMLWTLPDGRLIPLAQWTIADPPKEDQGTVVVDEVTEQVAPTARGDAFGVRQGEPAPLPVLLNDFDPNKRDVLTIVPDSLSESGLPEAFGTLELLPDAQSLVVRPKAGASGSATFTYRITDGALTSEPATVVLTVVGDSVNTAPAWCPVEGCQRAWSVPAIAPGGTLVYPILEGWVDPEGDPMMLADVALLRAEDPANALVTADGRLAVRHTDVNAGASEIMLRLTVRDARGAEQQRELQVSVQPGAPATFQAAATTVQAGATTALRPLERVAGGSGSFVITDVTVQAGGERVKAVARTGDGSVEVSASAPGEALLSVGIRDIVTGGEITGAIRVTATPGAAPLTLPPLRAFVRPLADSTVEILDAIPGAASRALSVQSVAVVDGDLRADVVEHARVRVAGSTADGGAGRIGSVDVSVIEGTVGTVGRLTVFQVPESGSRGAIAVADSASVRAGSVVDIRVLDNDVAAPGERLILHPEVTGSGADGELAFASGGVLRYLAPKQPGVYKLSYTTYGASSPEAGDVGTVTVTVLPLGANQDPSPSTVSVRIAPGEQGEVQVPLSGVDPDGDRVRLVSVGKVEDPQVTAMVSASGTALTVAAAAQANAGLHTVQYTVRDGEGGSGTGTLRIIVTAASRDVGAPVASSDYVRVVRGSKEPIAVRPLDNDIDPARGTLTLVSVTPNVPGGETNPEYQKLVERLDLSKLKDGLVRVTPGEELGTVSFRYTVKSSVSSSTADGLLLVQTSERVGAQAPRITDTVLNVRERNDLSDKGVDVVADKVRWAVGDVNALTLSLWDGNRGGYRVSGNKILGDYNPNGDLVAFQLSGVDASGSDVSSYGFLIIPPLDELRITLKAGVEPLRVDENKSADAELRSFLDLSPGDRIELTQGQLQTGRPQASCSTISANEIRYVAGAEAPWDDTCVVSVRLIGQKNWTALPIPVVVVPRAPVVQLEALTRTIAPGESETIDLHDMVQWLGNRPGDVSKLRFTVTGGGSLFAVQPSGTSVTVTARADATPGSQEGLTVAVTGVGDSQAPLTLRIGEAPRDQPRGATVKLTCTVGSACGMNVIGAPGEHDPFAGKTGGALRLDTVSGAACTFGAVTKASDTGVTVAWPDNRGPGGSCTIGYTVRDAQNRIGEGTIEFDAQGVPRAPQSLEPQSFTGTSVTFLVRLGAAQGAHPSVTGVEVTGAGSSSCSPSGPAAYECVVSGLVNGEQHDFVARAINAVGQSDPTSVARAWAYKTPSPPTITQLDTVSDPRVTQTQGVVEFSLVGEDDVAGYRVTIGGTTQEYSGRNQSNLRLVVPVGGQLLSVVSLSRHLPPPGAPSEGTAGTRSVNVAGAPIAGTTSLNAPTNTSLKATMGGANSNFSEVELRYFFTIKQGGWFASPPDPCSTNPSDYGANGRVFEGLNRYTSYSIRACVYNGFGFDEAPIVSGSPQRVGGGTVPAPGGQLSFTISTTAVLSAGNTRGDYNVATEAAPVAAAGAFLEYRVGEDNSTISPSFTHSPNDSRKIEVRQCFAENDPESCSNWVTLTATTAPTVAWAQIRTGECIAVGDMRSRLNFSGALSPFIASAIGDATGKVTVRFNGAFASLTPAATPLVLTGTVCPPPEPDPDPDPDPGP